MYGLPASLLDDTLRYFCHACQAAYPERVFQAGNGYCLIHPEQVLTEPPPPPPPPAPPPRPLGERLRAAWLERRERLRDRVSRFLDAAAELIKNA